jgi:hypothetical protein
MLAQAATSKESHGAPSRLRANALRFISEQAAVPIDQLARFIKATLPATASLVEELAAERCVRTEIYFDGDLPWVWLTRKGASAAQTGHSYRVYPPYHATLRHRREINEVRLHLEKLEPKGRWTSETAIQGRRPKGARIPDGLFEVGGERHAIEVELSPKTKRQYRILLAENSARYDAVVYFCAPQTGRKLRRLKETENWPKLIVRDLPGYAPRVDRRPRREAKRDPEPEEIGILRLIAEQGTIRIDQLARFLDCGSEIAQIIETLSRANYLTRERCLAGEPDWIALTWVGNRLSGTSLECFKPGIGGVHQRHALNELRLYLAARSPDARWISRRVLQKTHGKYAKVPHAEVRLGGNRYAINVRLTASNAPTLVPRTDLQNDAYDAVAFFCVVPRARLFMERLQETHRWSKVVIRDMPKLDSYRSAPREAEQLVSALLRD